MSIATPAASSRTLLPAISMAIVIITLGIAVVTVLLAVAEAFALSREQTSSLIIASYVIPNVASVILTAIYRQPLFIGWSVMGVVFSASFAGVYTYPELLGTTMVAGAVVLLIGGLGLSARLAQAVPGSIVMGIVAALVMPFVVDIFTYLDESPLLVGTTVITYLVGRRLLPSQIPPILPALALGLAVAGATGTLHGIAGEWALPTVVAMRPAFDWRAILTVTPVLVALMAGMANLGAVVYLQTQDYRPPARTIDVTSGIGTMLSALLAPVSMAMAIFITPLTVGQEAGPRHLRPWIIYLSSGGMMGANYASSLPAAVPTALLFTVAGLAMIPVLGNALSEITRGPLKLGPLFAFVVASSDLSLGGLGAAFWGLVIGMAVTALLEGDAWRRLRTS